MEEDKNDDKLEKQFATKLNPKQSLFYYNTVRINLFYPFGPKIIYHRNILQSTTLN